MLGRADFGRCARKRADRIDQFDRTVGVPAFAAVIACLIGGVTIGARARDEAVGQKRALLGIEQLLNIFFLDQTGVTKRLPELSAQLFVGVAVRAAVVVVADLEAGKVPLMFLARLSDHFLFRAAFFACSDHDRSTMRVVCPHENATVPAKLLKANPDVGLDIFDQMA